MNGLLGQIGGALLVLCIAGLWLAVLVPGWIERHNTRSTARNAARMQRAVNVIARNQELPEEYEEEVSARRVLSLARQARRLERERAKAERARVRSAVPSAVRAGRRGIAVGMTIVLVGVIGALIGLTQATGWVGGWYIAGIGAVVALIGLLMRARAARLVRRHAASTHLAADVPLFDQSAWAGDDAETQAAASDERQWTPRPLPQPLGVTREAALAAALAEAERTGDAENVPGLRPGEPTGPDAEVHRLPVRQPASAESTMAAELQVAADLRAGRADGAKLADDPVANDAGEADGAGYAWMDDRAGVEASFDSQRLDDILNRRRNAG